MEQTTEETDWKFLGMFETLVGHFYGVISFNKLHLNEVVIAPFFK